MGLVPIDYDANGDEAARKLVIATTHHAFEYQQQRNVQAERLYRAFHCIHNMANRNPDRANLRLPKGYATLMSKAPIEIRALFSSQPFIPFKAKKKDDRLKEVAGLQSNMLDSLLYMANLKRKGALWDMLKMLYGTAYAETVPYYERGVIKMAIPQEVQTAQGPQIIGYERRIEEVRKFRLKLHIFAPWEVLVDPMATSVSEPGACRYIIKLRIVSKRQLKKDIEAGMYEGIDPKDIDRSSTDSEGNEKYVGKQILATRGLHAFGEDSDVGLISSYESEDRYIDLFDDRVVLRDRDNPYDKRQGGHGMINLEKMIHNIDPHTEAQWFGNSELGPVEQMGALYDDIFNMMMDAANFQLHGKTFHDDKIDPTKIVHQAGVKIAVPLSPGEKISDKILDSFGTPLSSDFYKLGDVVNEFYDIATGLPRPNYGQQLKGEHTLGEHMDISQSGDPRQELNISLAEGALGDLGHKSLCHIDQFSRDRDKIELVGEEGAMMLLMSHPQDLPGGFAFQFRGSDGVMNKGLRQQNLIGLHERWAGDPSIRTPYLNGMLAEAFDFGDEKDELIRSEEETVQIQMLQAGIDPGGGQGGGPGGSGGSSAQDQAGQTLSGVSQQAGQAAVPNQEVPV